MNDLKTVRDALEFIISAISGDEIRKNMVLREYIKSVRATLDRIIETPTPQGWSAIETAPKDGSEILLALWSGHPEHKTSFCWAINGHYKDGFFYSKDPMIGKLASPTHWQHIAAPTPTPTEKVDLDALKREIPESWDEYKLGEAQGWNACIDHLANTGRLR